MKNLATSKSLLAVFLFGALTACGPAGPSSNLEPRPDIEELPENVAFATFGGGCFWCVEEVFHQTPGVLSAVSGYMGGTAGTANYSAVSAGITDHAEVVQVAFDSETVTYDELLDVFFRSHDPTQLNRQGPDRGRHYRSVVFYHDDLQREAVEARIAKMREEETYGSRPIVTEVSAAQPFYPAEEYHQDFARLNPNHGYLKSQLYPKLKKLGMEVPE